MKKRQHTIPKCYLANFCDPSGKTWVLDSNGKIFCTNPINVFVENHFYSITLKSGEKSVVVEDTLSNIESAFASIFDLKISKDVELSPEERAKIAIFFAGMMLRTKPHREAMKGMFEKMAAGLREWDKQFQTLSKTQKQVLPVEHGSGPSFTLEELEEGLKIFDEEHAAGLVNQIVEMAQLIFEMKWAILKFPPGKGNFVTSDDPFVMVRPEAMNKYGRNSFRSVPGLGYEDVEVTLPLSKDRMILAGWKLEQDSYSPIPEWMARSLNERTIRNASERIVACNESQLREIDGTFSAKAELQNKSS